MPTRSNQNWPFNEMRDDDGRTDGSVLVVRLDAVSADLDLIVEMAEELKHATSAPTSRAGSRRPLMRKAEASLYAFQSGRILRSSHSAYCCGDRGIASPRGT